MTGFRILEKKGKSGPKMRMAGELGGQTVSSLFSMLESEDRSI